MPLSGGVSPSHLRHIKRPLSMYPCPIVSCFVSLAASLVSVPVSYDLSGRSLLRLTCKHIFRVEWRSNEPKPYCANRQTVNTIVCGRNTIFRLVSERTDAKPTRTSSASHLLIEVNPWRQNNPRGTVNSSK